MNKVYIELDNYVIKTESKKVPWNRGMQNSKPDANGLVDAFQVIATSPKWNNKRLVMRNFDNVYDALQFMPQAIGFLPLSIEESENTLFAVKKPSLHYGKVLVTDGKYKGLTGFYDDDDDIKAIVYLDQNHELVLIDFCDLVNIETEDK